MCSKKRTASFASLLSLQANEKQKVTSDWNLDLRIFASKNWKNWRRKKDQMCINASFTCSHFARQISPTRLVRCIAGQLPPVPPSKCTFRHFHICQITFAYLHTLLHIVNVMRFCNGLWCCITISATLGVSVIALGFGGAPNLTLDRHLLPTLLLPPRPHNNWELH